jgi:hypothetical protein
MNEMFERGFNAGLVRALEHVRQYPAEYHGYLRVDPHTVAAQVRDEIAAGLVRLIDLKFEP